MDMRRQLLLYLRMQTYAMTHVDQIGFLRFYPFDINKGFFQRFMRRVMHGKLPIFGYRIGNMAYLTDVKYLPEEEYAKLEGLDVLILTALRRGAHPTHADQCDDSCGSDRFPSVLSFRYLAEEKEAVCFVLRLGLFGLKSCWQKNELCHFLHP